MRTTSEVYGLLLATPSTQVLTRNRHTIIDTLRFCASRTNLRRMTLPSTVFRFVKWAQRHCQEEDESCFLSQCGHCCDNHHISGAHPVLPLTNPGVSSRGKAFRSFPTATFLCKKSQNYGNNECLGKNDDNPFSIPERNGFSPELSYCRTSWYPVAYTSLFGIGFASALDVGDYPGAWSSASWNFLACSGGDVPYTVHTIVSTIVFTAATTALHHLNRDDPYQDCFLFAGMTSGIGVGICLGSNIENTMLKVLPWAILMALLCSTILHQFLPATNLMAVGASDLSTWHDTEIDNTDEY